LSTTFSRHLHGTCQSLFLRPFPSPSFFLPPFCCHVLDRATVSTLAPLVLADAAAAAVFVLAPLSLVLAEAVTAVVLALAPPPLLLADFSAAQSLHVLLSRWCSQILLPPQSLHPLLSVGAGEFRCRCPLCTGSSFAGAGRDRYRHSLYTCSPLADACRFRSLCICSFPVGARRDRCRRSLCTFSSAVSARNFLCCRSLCTGPSAVDARAVGGLLPVQAFFAVAEGVAMMCSLLPLSNRYASSFPKPSNHRRKSELAAG